MSEKYNLYVQTEYTPLLDLIYAFWWGNESFVYLKKLDHTKTYMEPLSASSAVLDTSF
jgi:hypothetical protein